MSKKKPVNVNPTQDIIYRGRRAQVSATESSNASSLFCHKNIGVFRSTGNQL